ncbi:MULTISPECIES: DUF1178 family protein [unclassified Novosphingobium]|uniref:DUF1178 family protein n=1 Tax=unclassified Novosphingobium TaxID=2644732 RepID=UPI0025F176C3|nr:MULTISPECIES: DUF1178 family protein [unclassified Novosphingobium]HQV02676.1 DUF1178 family protein [Novosphingobium sp.]
MIVFDLACPAGHRFEGWFGSSEDYASQRERGLVSCPHCGSPEIDKAPMAPAVARKGNQMPSAKPAQSVVGGGLPPEAQAVMAKLAELQAQALKQSRWVGKDFAEQSREMHYGERDTETIHGQATLEEAKDLVEEGIAVMPLPFPVASPDNLN